MLVLAGRGGNGGGGLVAARRLHNWGAEVKIITSRPGSQFVDVPGHQMNILTEMGLSIIHQRDISELPEDRFNIGCVNWL